MYHCEVLHALLDTLLLAERNGIAVPPLLPEKSPGHVPGPGGLGRPGPHHPAPGGQRRHRRRGPAGGGGPAVPGPAAGRRGPGAPLRGDAVGLRPRRSGPAGGPCRRPGPTAPPRSWRPAATISSAPAGAGRIPGSISAPAAWAAAPARRSLCRCPPGQASPCRPARPEPSASGGTGRNPPSCSVGRRGATTPTCSAPGTAPATGMSLFSPPQCPQGLCLD